MTKQHFLTKAAHHAQLHKAHAESHSYFKSKHDAADDADVNKAALNHLADHHKDMAEQHKAMDAHYKSMAEECDKAAPTGDLSKTAATATATPTPAPAPAAATPAVDEYEYVSLGQTTDGVEAFKKVKKTAGSPAPAAARPSSGDGITDMVNETTKGLVKSALEMMNNDDEVKGEIRRVVLEGVRDALGNKVVPDGVRGAIPNMPEFGKVNLVPRAGGPAKKEEVDPELEDMFAL